MITRNDKYTETDKRRDFYSDFQTNLTAHPNTQDLVRNTNEEAIKAAIRNLFLTNRYERLFQPDLFGGIRALLFEPMLPSTADAIKTLCRQTIENHEPRAKIIDVRVVPNESSNSYRIDVYFYTINSPEPIGLAINLYRVR